MKKNKHLQITQKLQLTRTTIRRVSNEVLGNVAGGGIPTATAVCTLVYCGCGGGYTKEEP